MHKQPGHRESLREQVALYFDGLITAHNAILDAALVQARRVSADHVTAALADVL